VPVTSLPDEPQAFDATFPAVCGPPNGSVNPLVTAPTTQKLVFTGAYSSVPKKLPAPYVTSWAVDSRDSASHADSSSRRLSHRLSVLARRSTSAPTVRWS